jgi:hypothetical protein
MGMATDSQVKSFGCSHWKNVGIMRKKDICRAREHKVFGPVEVPPPTALVVDTDEVQYGIPESQRLGLHAQEMNAVFRALDCGVLLRSGVNLMIPVAAKDAGIGT